MFRMRRRIRRSPFSPRKDGCCNCHCSENDRSGLPAARLPLTRDWWPLRNARRVHLASTRRITPTHRVSIPSECRALPAVKNHTDPNRLCIRQPSRPAPYRSRGLERMVHLCREYRPVHNRNCWECLPALARLARMAFRSDRERSRSPLQK